VESLAETREYLRRAESVLADRRIVRIEYVSPASASELEAPAAIDSVRMGVELELDDGAICSVAWRMEGACEGLVVGPGRVESLRTMSMDLQRTDRTDTPQWRSTLGQPVRRVGAGWQESSSGCPETLWAIHLQLDHGGITIALGEVDSDGPRYQPDELVVIFDGALAERYWIPAAIDSPFRSRGY